MMNKQGGILSGITSEIILLSLIGQGCAALVGLMAYHIGINIWTTLVITATVSRICAIIGL